jgi:hypothetical protein
MPGCGLKKLGFRERQRTLYDGRKRRLVDISPLKIQVMGLIVESLSTILKGAVTRLKADKWLGIHLCISYIARPGQAFYS